jgi:hypothetical protein
MGKKTVWNAGVFINSPLFPADTSTSISVKSSKDDSFAVIYSNRDGAAKSNPFTISESGKIEFYADPGRYNITATSGVETVTWDDEIIKPQSILTQEKTASFQVAADDLDVMFVITGSNNVDITVPSEATDTLDQDFIFHVRHDGTGILTIVQDTGVTIIPQPGGSLVIPIDGTVSCSYPRTTVDRWVLYGNLVAA